MHQFQHRITAALQRDMEMWHERPTLRTIGNQFVGEQIWFQRTDPISSYSFYSIKSLDQIDKRLSGGFSEITNIDTRQNDLLASLTSGLLGLLYQQSNARVPTESTGIRDCTIRTEIVTTILHFQEVTCTITTRTRRSKRFNIFRLYLIILMQTLIGVLFRPCLREVLYQNSLLVGAKHQVDPFDGSHPFRLQLGITSSHHNKGTRMLTYHPTDSLSTLMVSYLGHRTGVDQTDVGSLSFLNSPHTHILKHPTEGGCLREIQFAP